MFWVYDEMTKNSSSTGLITGENVKFLELIWNPITKVLHKFYTFPDEKNIVYRTDKKIEKSNKGRVMVKLAEDREIFGLYGASRQDKYLIVGHCSKDTGVDCMISVWKDIFKTTEGLIPGVATIYPYKDKPNFKVADKPKLQWLHNAGQ
jgi:hypothetical protein